MKLDRRTLRSCHVYAMLKKYARGKHISFHTPGHKIGKWDITELPYSDNLASPQGCIAQAEREIAALLDAKKSFILTDGSTSGVLSMLYAAKSLGAKSVAFPVDSHKSVWNGCAAFGLTPVVGDVFEEKAALADCILVTSPTYYGETVELQKLREYCDEHRKILLIDGAHGGHLRYQKELHAGTYADMWVDGVHKSLPALTQGAVVSAKTEIFADVLQKAVNIFRTSSPSYPVMASVEYAVKYPRNEKLEKAAYAFMEHERVLKTDDWTKICVFFGEYAFATERTLQKMGIYAEFCDGNILTFYLSPATSMKDFKRLQKTLLKLFKSCPYTGEKVIQRVHTPIVSVVNDKTEWVEIENAEGRICAGNCGLFPPCTPLILSGERVTKEKIALIKQAANVYGIIDGKMNVFTEE